MPYKTQSSDTSPEMEKLLFELLRQKTPAERFQMTNDITEAAIDLWRAGVVKRHPEWSEQEVSLHWVEAHYGSEWAERIRRELRAEVTAG
jgi:hypothetical protein